MTVEPRIFSLHYFGARYANNRIPVEVLPDLPAFRELLLSYAKDEWRARHPEHKKLPKNFDKVLALSLFDIADGSAIPKLEWKRSKVQEPLFDLPDELDGVVEDAYAKVIVLFDNDDRTPELNSEKLRALNRFGAGLRPDERIELTARDGSGKVVCLDIERRKRLITGARDTYQARFDGTGELVGTISPSDPNAQCFIHVLTDEQGTVQIPVDRLQLYEEFADALNTEVQFELLADFDKSDKLRGVVDVFDVATVSEDTGITKAKQRLEELGHLADGWHDGEGVALSRKAIAKALDFVIATRGIGIEHRIFPTEFGGILIEFAICKWEYTVEVAPAGTFEMYGIEVAGAEEMEPTPFESVDAVANELRRRLSANG